MDKWILATADTPLENAELLCIFDGMAGEVWHAKRVGGKYYGIELDSEGMTEIHGALICWIPWPGSPFRDDA